MGNKLCKKKDNVDSVATEKENKSFDRILSRLRLKPSSWKSESHLNNEISPKTSKKFEVGSTSTNRLNSNVKSQALSKSTDWTNCNLDEPDETIHLPNPKLSLIFNNNDIKETPTPPPRKHKKTVKEKIEAVAKGGFQALKKQSNTNNNYNKTHISKQQNSEQRKDIKEPAIEESKENNSVAVEEPVFIKKQINYKCPICDDDEVSHNRDHHHKATNKKHIENQLEKSKYHKSVERQGDNKRQKNLSVVSLPNYTDLKLSTAENADIIIDKQKQFTQKDSQIAGSTGKLDNYLTRCRSFGSIFPSQKGRDRLKIHNHSGQVENDEDELSCGFEDWDGLHIIEHYHPKDTSLPRPRKTQNDVISDLESLIVKEEEIPKPPIRKSESLIKKLNRKSEMSTNLCSNRKSVTPPPSPEKLNESDQTNNELVSTTGDHSNLMKILQEFCIKDSKTNNNLLTLDETRTTEANDEKVNNSKNGTSCLTKNLELINLFIVAEKQDANFK